MDSIDYFVGNVVQERAVGDEELSVDECTRNMQLLFLSRQLLLNLITECVPRMHRSVRFSYLAFTDDLSEPLRVETTPKLADTKSICMELRRVVDTMINDAMAFWTYVVDVIAAINHLRNPLQMAVNEGYGVAAYIPLSPPRYLDEEHWQPMASLDECYRNILETLVTLKSMGKDCPLGYAIRTPLSEGGEIIDVTDEVLAEHFRKD